MKTYQQTEQLSYWQQNFGDIYTKRNHLDPNLLRARTAMWARILKSLTGRLPKTVLEVGSNIGVNLHALNNLIESRLIAMEPNAGCRKVLAGNGLISQEDILDGVASHIPLEDQSVELAFTSGVLIHIHPNQLEASCREIHRVSSRYLLCIEYFSDQPRQIPYRGEENLLFLRDFGSYYLDLFPQLEILDYGFFWRKITQLDNLTWWLFEKK
ncbi:pseudaminic acid biosynthesis-associated methylase [Magnetococcales bacterium HHB-1]